MRYRAIMADPGWQYQQTFSSPGSSLTPRSAEENYTVTGLEEICNLAQLPGSRSRWQGAYPDGVIDHRHLIAGHEIEFDALLFLWITNPMLVTDTAHLKVCRAWGFKPKQLITWVKGRLSVEISDKSPSDPTFDDPHGCGYELFPKLTCRTGMGHYTRGVTEHIVVATRGQPKVFVKDHGVNNLIVAEEDTVIVAPPQGHSKKPKEAYELIERLIGGPYLELFARERRPGWDAWGDQLHG